MTDLISSVLETAAALEGRLDRGLAPFNLTVPSYRALRAIERAEANAGALTPGDLAAFLIQSPHSVSGLIGRLIKAGYIRREYGGNGDARRHYLHTTDEGRALVLDAAGTWSTAEYELDLRLGDVISGSFLAAEGINTLREAAIAISPYDLDRTDSARRLTGATS